MLNQDRGVIGRRFRAHDSHRHPISIGHGRDRDLDQLGCLGRFRRDVNDLQDATRPSHVTDDLRQLLIARSPFGSSSPEHHRHFQRLGMPLVEFDSKHILAVRCPLIGRMNRARCDRITGKRELTEVPDHGNLGRSRFGIARRKVAFGRCRRIRHDGSRDNALACSQVAFKEQRGEREHLTDVIESMANVIRGKTLGGIKVHTDQIANRVAILGAVEPPHRHASRLGWQGRIQLLIERLHHFQKGFAFQLLRTRRVGRWHRASRDSSHRRLECQTIALKSLDIRDFEKVDSRLPFISLMAIDAVPLEKLHGCLGYLRQSLLTARQMVDST